ncbi:MAG: HAD-IB family hydrolase [Sphingobium sp.]|uniref:HAD family hydrolase n=1 Tax=Sphingobium sp. TaxID=1912891 RepID=UPI0029B2D15A|nr:HAD-IB family hydrolase [Sphingobium sp.]MDX3908293.1 HAD-IB family hydrolase [Sphingobium sp.]
MKPVQVQRKLAIYDMDRTITVTGTYSGFLMHIALALSPWRLIFLPLVPLVMLAYVLRLIDRSRVKEWNQALMIGYEVRREALTPHLKSYAEKVIANNVRKDALIQVGQDRAEGYHLVLATASYRLYVESIAESLGFDTVIATDNLSQDLSYVRARIAGENCYDEGKLRMIQAWMARHGIPRTSTHIRAYSDHVSDAPMLAFADEPYAANPHKPLAKLALEKGWPRVDWA